MKKLQIFWAGIAIVLVLVLTLQAQTAISIRPVFTHAPVSSSSDDLNTMLEAVEATTPVPAASVPVMGTFHSAQNPLWPPLPGNLNNTPAWDLGDGIWLLDDLDVDYTARTPLFSRGGGGMHAMDEGPPSPGDGDGGTNSSGGGGFSPAISFPTNNLWLQITNVSNGLAYLNLMNGTDSVYEIYSTVALVNGSNNWTIEQEVWPTNPAVMPFIVPELDRTNLFIWARDWTGITSLGNTTPEWWFWKYFGTVDLSDTNRDSSGDSTLLFDYEYSHDPNVIEFYFALPPTPATSNSVNTTLGIIQGTPFYVAILVNDTNTADAVWQPYSSNIVVNLDSGNGVYNVLIGLRGLPADATQTWESDRVSVEVVTPSLTITNPVSSTVSVPMIQLQGLVNEGLSSLTFDVSNAVGVVTNQQGYWQPAFIDTNLLAFTTNSFHCYDIELAAGTNLVTLHATDKSGNTTATSVTYTLSYAGVTNPPALNLIWPTNGTVMGGSNFTMQAQVSDATTTVTATINSNTVQGLVERSGAVWFNNLPLGSGTNTVTITATSAAGSVNTTNLNVVESSVSLSIDPISSDQLNQSAVTVTGTVTPGQNVWVNGVGASVDEDGDWEADGVAVSPTGTANLNVQAGTDTNDIAATATLNQPQPATVMLASFSEAFEGNDPDNEYHTPDWSDTVANWTYDLGGSENEWGSGPTGEGGFPNFGNYSMTEGFSPSATVWENGVSESAYGEYGTGTLQISQQSQTMIVPAGQQAAGGTSVYLVSASAMAFSEPAAALDFDAGDEPVAPETLAVNGQTLVNSGLTNVDGSVSGLTLVSGPSGAPLPLKFTSPVLASFANQAQAVHLAIIDTNSGVDLTLQTNTVIVGQPMSWQCRWSVTNQFMTNFPLANFSWTVPGFAVTNFYVSTDVFQTNGYPILLSATNNQVIYFWWADGATNRVVQCSATINGKTITAQATFNVLKPQANIIAKTDDVSLGYTPNALYYGICFGTTNESMPGISFSNTVTMPPGNTYNYGNTNYFVEWVQLISSNPESIIENGTNHIFQSTGVVLDTSYDYGFTTYPNTDDSPSITLSEPNETAASDTQISKMWLMFRPYGGRLVPLRTVSWSFSGAATNSGTGWILTSKSWSTNPPDADAGTTYPVWTNNVANTNTFQWNPPF